jgi:WD40 repeat protein
MHTEWQLEKVASYKNSILSIHLDKKKTSFEVCEGKPYIEDFVGNFIHAIADKRVLKSYISFSQKLLINIVSIPRSSNFKKNISARNTIELLDIERRCKLFSFKITQKMNVACFSECEKYFGLYSDNDKKIYIFDWKNRLSPLLIRVLDYYKPIRSMAINEQKRLILLGSIGNKIHIYHNLSNDPSDMITFTQDANITAACFDDSGECFAVGSINGRVYMFVIKD